MKKPDSIDTFLRQSLIDWALEDIEHPLKRATLEAMSGQDWLHDLYGEAKNEQSVTKLLLQHEKVTKPFRPTNLPPEFEEEEWVKDLLKNVFHALKKAYRHKFEATTKWGMRRINTTGMYVLGPMNAYGEIFFKFKVGMKGNIFYWDLENHRGKIRPKGFEAVPRVILDVLKEKDVDFLIRKISKGFGIMHYTNEISKIALSLLLAMKEEGIGIGSDAHGQLWLQAGKQKRYRLAWEESEQGATWFISEKTSDAVLDCFSTKAELMACIQELNLINICPKR